MTETQVAILLADLALIIVVAQVVGRIARMLGQPAVIGEIVGGVLVGPTLLDGAVADALFPMDVRPYLGALANLGLVLFMFFVGMEFDFDRLRGSGRIAGATVVGSTLVPFVLGLLLAVVLMNEHRPANRPAFMLFIGVAVSVTAFPVLARILADRGMSGTWLGAVALSTAAICDLAAWTTLAGVQALAGGSHRNYWQVMLVVPFAVFLITCVRPLLRRGLTGGERDRQMTPGVFAVVVSGALLSAAVTQLIGLHFVIGAFLFGIVMPRLEPGRFREDLLHRTQSLTGMLLPVYFITAGLKVDLSGIGVTGLYELGLILAVAIAGKFAGTWAGARSQGLSARGSAVLASLMNTRGLTELIALSVGLQAGLLDERLYSLFVVMAVITTAMTGPLLLWLTGRGRGGPAGLQDLDGLAPARSGPGGAPHSTDSTSTLGA
ncbi:cation:proton antiporter [Streptomyces sp. NPDC053086]|uniref:cation:proton antiporter n=1 Tax=unclassified Streptomyces TaxID=2593676 RepID=UPI0037D71F25